MLSTYVVNGFSGNELRLPGLLRPYPRYVSIPRLSFCLDYGPVSFSAFKLEWRTFLLGSSVVNVLALSDFDLEEVVFQTVAMSLIE